MTNKSNKKHIVVPDTITPERILLQWLAEIDRFHDFCYQINALLPSTAALAQAPPPPTAHIGQCPLAQLITLHHAMQAELETLLADMEHWPKHLQAPPHRRLAAHSRLLSRLNQRAQSSLLLATASPA